MSWSLVGGAGSWIRNSEMLAKGAVGLPGKSFPSGWKQPRLPALFGCHSVLCRSRRRKVMLVTAGYSRRPMDTPGAYQLIDDVTGEKFIVWGGTDDDSPIPSRDVLSWNPIDDSAPALSKDGHGGIPFEFSFSNFSIPPFLNISFSSYSLLSNYWGERKMRRN